MKLFLSTLEERLALSTVTLDAPPVALVSTLPAGKVTIARADLDAIRADPGSFVDLLAKYREPLLARLGSRAESLNEQDLAFTFAVATAYQLAYYRSPLDPSHGPAPASLGLSDLLHTFKLQCREYCYLAAGLFRLVYPETPDTSLRVVRFTRSAMATHTQLFYVSPRVSMMGDPTIGLVARASLESLQAGQRLDGSGFCQLSHRAETSPFTRRNMAAFSAKVYASLRHGLYARAVIGTIEEA